MKFSQIFLLAAEAITEKAASSLLSWGGTNIHRAVTNQPGGWGAWPWFCEFVEPAAGWDSDDQVVEDERVLILLFAAAIAEDEGL